MQTALLVRARLSALVATGAQDQLSNGTKGALIGAMDRAVGGGENRRFMCAWLFRAGVGELSSKALTPAEWYALWRWVDLGHDELGRYHPAPSFYAEALSVLREAMRAKAVKLFGVDYDGLVAEAAALPTDKVILALDGYASGPFE